MIQEANGFSRWYVTLDTRVQFVDPYNYSEHRCILCKSRLQEHLKSSLLKKLKWIEKNYIPSYCYDDMDEDVKEGYVYILKIQNDFKYKIGITTDIKSRVSTIQNASPFDIDLLHYRRVPNYISIEKELHLAYRDKRVKREWFSLSDRDVEDIKLLLEQKSICQQ